MAKYTEDDLKVELESKEYEYGFSNIRKYNPVTKIQRRMGATIYNNPGAYPYDFFVVASTKLPSDLNSYMNAFGKKRKQRLVKKAAVASKSKPIKEKIVADSTTEPEVKKTKKIAKKTVKNTNEGAEE